MTSKLVTPGPAKNEDLQRREVCTVGRWMYEREFIVAAQGNISVRLRDGNILMTHTRANKGMLDPADMVVIDIEGRQISGALHVSSEIGMHLLFYRARADVNAICHAQPLAAARFAAAGRGLDQALIPETIVGLGEIPLVRHAALGTPELTAVLEPFVPHYDALLLPNREVEKLMAARARNSVSLSPCKGGLPAMDDDKENAEHRFSHAHRELNAQIGKAGCSEPGRN